MVDVVAAVALVLETTIETTTRDLCRRNPPFRQRYHFLRKTTHNIFRYRILDFPCSDCVVTRTHDELDVTAAAVEDDDDDEDDDDEENDDDVLHR